MTNYEDLMKTAKQNTSSTKGSSSLVVGDPLDKGSSRSMTVGRKPDSDKLKEPPPRSSSPVGRALLEQNYSRRKNKRSHDTMEQGANPTRVSPVPPPPGHSSGSSLAKSSRDESRSGSASGPTKSCDLVRRPLRSPVTSSPQKLNGMRSSLQMNKQPSDKANGTVRQRDTLTSRDGIGSKAQVTAPSASTCTTSGGLRGSKASLPPPPSSLTPQQIQKLKAARAACAAASSGMPPTKKKALNPNAFYGSAAARILQQRGQPRLPSSRHMRYTSSYVDEMMDFLKYEGLNGVDDLYSDEDEAEMDDFIASDDEFIDDSDEGGDYSSAIRKIFGYDRSR